MRNNPYITITYNFLWMGYTYTMKRVLSECLIFSFLLVLAGNSFADYIDDERFQEVGYSCYGYPYNYCVSNDDFDPQIYFFPYPVYIHNGYGNAQSERFYHGYFGRYY